MVLTGSLTWGVHHVVLLHGTQLLLLHDLLLLLRVLLSQFAQLLGALTCAQFQAHLVRKQLLLLLLLSPRLLLVLVLRSQYRKREVTALWP
jgi:hypothetical protein